MILSLPNSNEVSAIRIAPRAAADGDHSSQGPRCAPKSTELAITAPPTFSEGMEDNHSNSDAHSQIQGEQEGCGNQHTPPKGIFGAWVSRVSDLCPGGCQRENDCRNGYEHECCRSNRSCGHNNTCRRSILPPAHSDLPLWRQCRLLAYALVN